MRRILIVLSSLLWILLLMPNLVSASSESIPSFDVKIMAHKNGIMDITETIIYDFGSNSRHGIYRDIPTVTKVGELYRQSKINITGIVRDNNNESYSLSQNSNQISVKIGRADQTISGAHTYIISYRVENGIASNYPDHDEIYWNVTGNNWQVPILSTSATITTDFGVLPSKTACFTGSQGSKEQNCEYQQNSFTTTLPLNPYQGITIVAGFPVNTFPKSILSSQAPTNSNSLSGLVTLYFGLAATLNFILAPILLIWYLKNKRKKRFGPVTVNFDIPKDLQGNRIAPAEAGTIDTARLDKNDIVATIFDLAIRKYVKIEQAKQPKTLGIFGGGDDYNIKKLKNYEDTETFEKILLDRLFGSGDDIAKVSSLKEDFYETFEDLDKEVFKSLVAKMYYTKDPKTQRGLLIFAGFISLILLGPLLAVMLFFLGFKLNGRTVKGDEIDFKIDGLKLFLKNMRREYKWQAENLYTVEKYIPYAMALGYINEFMEQLKIIYPNYRPNWYTGNMAFYAVSSSMFNSMNSGFTSAAPSSSGGFSGGGFSGGGGGGGGGGSW